MSPPDARSEGAPTPHPAAAPCVHAPDPAGAQVSRRSAPHPPPALCDAAAGRSRRRTWAGAVRGERDSRARGGGGAVRSRRRSAGSCAACPLHVPVKLFQTPPPPESVRALTLPLSLLLSLTALLFLTARAHLTFQHHFRFRNIETIQKNKYF